MNTPKCSFIISVYKDTESLDLILESLEGQTMFPDEVIISEDGDSNEMSEYFEIAKVKFSKLNLVRLIQEDIGWRKNRALNRAIVASKYDYLVFIDGDCVPYPAFVESHVVVAEKNAVLCGRRTEPGEFFSEKLRSKKLSVERFVSQYVWDYFKLKNDKVRHYDDGIYFNANSFVLGLIKKFRKKENHIVGCNFSCWKSDLVMINGFDEDFTLPTTGEDTDIERRLRHFGVKMNSCRYSANVIHLYHKKVFNKEISIQTEALMETKKDIFVCKNGLKKS